VNVFPTQIEEIVLQHEKLSGQYQVQVERKGLLDEVLVRCELNPAITALAPAEVEPIAKWLQQRIKTLVGISTRVEVLLSGSLERSLTGKARRVVDRRPKG
jgi:phenylacetate-CoA ligase